MLKIIDLQKDRQEDKDLIIEMTRSFMSLFANANSRKGYSPEDFFRTSYDDRQPETDGPQYTPEELKEKMEKVLKRNG